MNTYLKLLFSLVLFAILPSLSAQNYQWVKHIGGTGLDFCYLTTDNQGNIYAAGRFEYNLYLGNTVLTSLGHNDMFIVKYNSNGDLIWAKSFGGNNPATTTIGEDIECIKIIFYDSLSQCLYCTGYFLKTLNIDTIHLVSHGQEDAFLAKFDLNGNCIWIHHAGSSLQDDNGGINIDSSGNILWSCHIQTTGFVDTMFKQPGTYLCKIDTSGQLIWTRQMNSLGRFLQVGEILYYSGVCKGINTYDTITITPTGTSDPIIVKYNISTDKTLWVSQLLITGYFNIMKIISDSHNNLYVIGQFEDSLTIGNTTITANGNYDMYLCKLDTNGNFKWVRQCHATGGYGAFAYDICLDSHDNIFITGGFSGDATFGSFQVSAPGRNMFVARYDTTGNCIGVVNYGKAEGYGVSELPDGSIVACGRLMEPMIVGDTTFYLYPHINNMMDIYIIRLDAITGMQTIPNPGNEQLLIYANPSTGHCNIILPEAFVNEHNLSLSVFDNTGRQIRQYSVEMEDDIIKLNIDALAKGMYTAVLTNGKKKFTGKIVFQ